MEQFIIIEQSKADLSAIIEQVKRDKSSAIITDKNGMAVRISFESENYINQEPTKGKRLGGFLKGTKNTKPPKDFDRMCEDEIFALFAGEYDENTAR